MFVASLIMATLCGVSPDADIAELVDRLGAPRYVQRQEASQELEKRGRDALPALKAAKESKDPEVRARASDLIDKIENLLMVQPTLVRLDFKETPLPEVVKAISERSGINLTLVPENSPIWQSRRVTLNESHPVPFWTALDVLCRDGRLQHNSAVQGTGGPRSTVIQLFAGGNGMGPVPSSDHGPFRVSILGIHYQRDLRFGQNNQGMVNRVAPGVAVGVAGNRGVNEQFYLDMQILAEPRMILTQNGALHLTEVVADNGESLLVQANNGNAAVRNSGFFGYSSGLTSLQMQAHLKYPEKPSRTIRRLRGTLPVMVSARKDDALLVPLADSKGKSFKNDEVTLMVHEISVDPNQQRTTIDISLHSNNPATDENGVPGRFGANVFAGMNAPQNQMEILDANDRPYPQWFPSSTRIDNDEARMTLTLMPNEAVGPPAKIRFYEMARAATDVPFEFTDVTMP